MARRNVTAVDTCMYMLTLVLFVFHHIRLFSLVTLDRLIDIPGTKYHEIIGRYQIPLSFIFHNA